MAIALKSWLSDVFQGVDVFMSDHDIDAGSRWLSDLNSELEASNFGIICLTPENMNSAWILFEAGALSKAIKNARVIPYRLELKPTDVTGPLAQFQGVDADEAGTFRLLQSINNTREFILPDNHLRRAFEKWWPDLQKQLSDIPDPKDSPPKERTALDLLEEVLRLVRNLQPQADYDLEDTINWTHGKNIYQVDIDDMAQMSVDELKRYIGLVRKRWNETHSVGEESFLEEKIREAEKQIDRRDIDETTKVSAADPDEPTAGT